MQASPLSAPDSLVAPHGGALTPCVAPDNAEFEPAAHDIVLDPIAVGDLRMLASGAYAPLRGFMDAAACASVCAGMRLPSGVLWPIPILLPVGKTANRALEAGARVGLVCATTGTRLGHIDVDEVFAIDPLATAAAVFGTTDAGHPGVAAWVQRGPWHVGGRVSTVSYDSLKPSYDCRQSRAQFRERGWRRIVGFQTRNPIHRAHEYILKCALEICDGLFVHPLVGATKDDDIPAAVRMHCYHALVQEGLPSARVLLSTLPAPMRYAGPKEAVLHAIVRQNHGCSHFIIGRDHAGVGNFYGTYAAQDIFQTLRSDDLNIAPLCFDHAFFCRRCSAMATLKTCPHPPTEHVILSGTQVRDMLARGMRPPEEFTRAAVADVLIAWRAQH